MTIETEQSRFNFLESQHTEVIIRFLDNIHCFNQDNIHECA